MIINMLPKPLLISKKTFDTIDHGTPIEKLDQFSVKDIETDSYHM